MDADKAPLLTRAPSERGDCPEAGQFLFGVWDEDKVWGQEDVVQGQEGEVRGQEGELREQEGELREQEGEVQGQEGEVRGQEEEGLPRFSSINSGINQVAGPEFS
jgi:hypothetical protein